MKRKRHTEEQITAILKEHEAGMKTADLCRQARDQRGEPSTTGRPELFGLEKVNAKDLPRISGAEKF